MSDDFSNAKLEKTIIKHLIQNKKFCQNVMMFGRIVDGHFTKLFHLDAFTTIRKYYQSYGSPPPTEEKFILQLEKVFTYADSFKSQSSQLNAWKKGVRNLYVPLTEFEMDNLESDLDELEELRRKRIVQDFLVYSDKKLDSGRDVGEIFDRMAEDVNSVRSVESIVMEGNIVGDWEQHLKIMDEVERGDLRPVPFDVTGVIETTGDEFSFKKTTVGDLVDGGFFPGEMTIVVGENNVGKSFLLMEAAYGAARAGFNVLFFTIEMNKIKQQRRIYSRMSKIPYSKFKLARLTDEEKELMKKKIEIWKNNCGILHTVSFDKGATVVDIVNKTRDAESIYKCKFDFVVIDYLNDMKPVGKYQSSKSWDAMGEISWDLAQFSKYYNNHQGIPVLTANQKKTSKAGTSFTDWQDAAFSPLPIQHATVGIGIGQSPDDREIGRVRWDIFKTRDSGAKGVSFYTYPDFSISRISSLRLLNEYYSDLIDGEEE